MKKGLMKRGLSIILAVIMIFSSSAYDFSGVIDTYAAEKVEFTEDTTGSSLDAASDYGLAENAKDGVILHAWNWSFNQIKSELKDIAEAGFTSVQTSPIQPNKEGANVEGTSAWWKFYQPLDFTVCENQYGNINKLGTKEDFKALCSEADKYGIKIIVDVVANHLANNTGGRNTREERSSQIPGYLRDNDSYWHMNGYTESSDGDRYQMTQAPIGMPDLNTGNEGLQKIITDFLSDAQACGADGFRFDAAKHIETPSDNGFASQFWAKVKSVTQANDPNVFLYGEILNTAGPGNYGDMQKYTPYIRVTNNKYANNLREGIKNRSADAAKFTNNDIFGSNANEWVLWNESHDTYAGDYGENTDADFDDEEMALAWCAVAARTSPALYFSRPIANKGDGAWKSAALGQHTDMYKNERIAAVNKFHNYFAGQAEYVTSSDNVLVVERGTTGVALINFNRGQKSVNIKVNKMEDGTYTDQVTGSEFKVSGGTLTGNIGSGGVAAVYNAKPVPKTPTPTISKEGGSFSGDTLKLTIGLNNATSGTYKIGSAAEETYTSTKDIIIGSDMAFGDSVKITLKATDGTTTETREYTFTKVDKVVNKAYLAKPSDWPDTVYCYAYDSATEKVNNAEWPGIQMTKDSDTGYYVYEIPENIEKPRVIFNCGKSDDVHRHPADKVPGELFETDGSWIYKDGKWEKYNSPVTEEGKVTVNYVDGSGKNVADSKILKGKVGDTYTTTAADVSGYNLKTKPSNATGKYTKADITVTYVYEKASDDSITITSSLAEGTTFDTETKTITLTIKNATSGTYSVDNGPVKSFTGSADVVIGQGKIADTEVKVDVTATNGTDKVNKTFTYNKKFSGKAANETLSAASALAVSMEMSTASATKPASQYSTNGTGFGKEATITIDGSISDWDESMLIAQGTAWDVPNHWKGTHENCVIDIYSLYAAYDNDNLYVGVQMVNVGDTIYYEGCGALLDGGVPGDVPLIIALDTGKGNKMTGKLTDGKYVWGAQVDFNKKADHLLYMSCKPGLGQPSIFKAGSDGISSYDNPEYCISFKDAGISYDVAHDLLPTKLTGLSHNDGKIEDLLDSNGPWVDYKTFTDNQGSTHDSKYDSFFEVAIPYKALGITKSDITQNGVGVLAAGTRGESGLDCVPYDYDAMTDNIMGDYGQDSSTSGEKDDLDVLNVDYARVGKGGSPNPNPDPDPNPDPNPNPDPDPTPNPDPVQELTVNFGADRSSPQLNTTNLTLKAIAKGGKSPYKYEFFVDGTSVQSASATDSYAWTPTAGNHTIKVTVTDSDGTSLSSQKKYTIEGEGDYTGPTITSFTTDKTSAVEGDTVKISTVAEGTGKLQYRFTVTVNGQEETIQDYSSSATCNWNVSAAGIYTLNVYVKDNNGNTAKKSKSGYIVNPKQDVVTLEVKSISADKDSGTAIEGDTVKISATAEGKGELQYRFTVTSDGAEEIIRDYGTSNTCSWNTYAAGTYSLTVYVKDGDGNIAKKSKNAYVVNQKTYQNSIKISSFTVDKASGSVKVGDSIKLSVKATAQKEITYKFTALSGDNENIISNYSGNSTVTWKPKAAGTYILYVYVKDSDGNIVSKEIEGYTVKDEETPVYKNVSVTSFKTSKASNSITTGQSVRMTANATGGSGELEYQFVVKRGNGENQTVRKYSSDNSCQWIPAQTGKYTLYVYVKDSSTGKIVKKSIKNYNVKSALKIKSFTQSRKSGTAVVGDKVVVRVNATGGIGQKFYRYYYKLNGKKYMLKDYTATKKINWVPKKAGKYQLFVEATDDLGNKVTKKVNYTVIDKLKVKSLKADKSSVKAGQKVKLSASATGGTKGYSYKFKYVYKNKSVLIRGYSSSSSVNWKPKSKGKYKITVYVRDAKNRKTSKTVTLSVK
ncbi:MAG: starch-binding protein [Lachnospiraceae bacterium]|nr:starch-binding protein [Lachnospiraceae bacterium]